MPFIDIHTHIQRSEKEVVSIINLFPDEGVPDPVENCFFSVGLHPWMLENGEKIDEQLKLVEQKCRLKNIVAVGECGLDKLTRADFSLQEAVFIRQAAIAEITGKPVIIHCVKALNEIILLKKKLNPTMPWILHSYSGNQETTTLLQQYGFYFSFGKNLLNDNSKSRNSLMQLPTDHFFLETDETEFAISHLYDVAASIRKCDVEDLEIQLEGNFNRIFLG